MERYRGVLRAHSSGVISSVMADLAICGDGFPCSSPRLNAILFMGDHVKKFERLGSPTLDRLSKLDNVASVVEPKLGPEADLWLLEAPRFAWKSVACFDGYLPSLSPWGDPMGYDPRGLPAASTTLSMLKDAARKVFTNVSKCATAERFHSLNHSGAQRDPGSVDSIGDYRTIVMGFSKGGVVLNQLLAEVAHIHQPDYKPSSPNVQESQEGFPSLPHTTEEFLNSIEEFHYIDVGLNDSGAYQTDAQVLEQIAKVAKQRRSGLTIFMHGTPRQWQDPRRAWIGAEKDQCVRLLRDAAEKFAGGKLKVHERLYFPDKERSLEMHFEILEALELS